MFWPTALIKLLQTLNIYIWKEQKKMLSVCWLVLGTESLIKKQFWWRSDLRNIQLFYVVLTVFLWRKSFWQWCWWRLGSSGVSRRVDLSAVTDVLKNLMPSSVRPNRSSWDCYTLPSFETSVNISQSTGRNVSGEMNLWAYLWGWSCLILATGKSNVA